jgi:hypothetical protein
MENGKSLGRSKDEELRDGDDDDKLENVEGYFSFRTL